MRDVVVTGAGVVSCAGESIEALLTAFRSGVDPRIDDGTFAPYPVHPVVSLDWDRQILKKSDQRQMEPWQRLGVYAAGLALDAAGIKEDAALKRRMHLVVAAGGGERDCSVDTKLLSGLRNARDKGVFVNEQLMSELRPTLFLAQLSNLLAGNISIVHGISGGSRTFMGEESSGVEALRIARERIAFGQNDIFLVGGSYNAERPDALLIHEMGGYLWKDSFRSVWGRPAMGGGFILGSGACFVVLEALEHAEERGAKATAIFAGVASDRTRREPGSVQNSLLRLWNRLRVGPRPAIVSGATGVVGITEEEQGALCELAPGIRPHATGDVIGHTMEAQPIAGFAVAASLIAAGDASHAAVTSVGHRRGEAVMHLMSAG